MSQKRNDISIEIWGAPGVGKTTLGNQLVEEHGYTKFASTNKGKSKLFLLFRYPRTVFVWSFLILENYFSFRDRVILRYNISLLFSSLQKIQYTHSKASTQFIIDEGLVQRLLSYSDIVYTPAKIKKILAVSPIGRVFVWVNDRDVIAERYTPLHQRALPGKEYLALWKKNQAKNIPVIAEALKSNDNIVFLETARHSIADIVNEVNKVRENIA